MASRRSGIATRVFCVVLGLLVAGLVSVPSAESGGCICTRDPGGDGGGHPPPPPPPPPAPPDEEPPPPSDETPPDEPPPPEEEEEPEPTTPSEEDPPEAPEPEEPEPATTESEPATPTPQPPTPPTPSAPMAPAPVTGAPTPGPAGSGRRAKRAPTAVDVMTTWRGWWAVNDRALLPERADILAVSTPSEDGETYASRHRRKREAVVQDEILPALRSILDPEAKGSDLLRRTGLIALGKVARDESDSSLLVHWLANDDAAMEVRDAAAFGIGMLRRSTPERQFDARILDALRGQLTRIVEDDDVDDDVRATAAIALGLLGDQPYGRGIHESGRLVAQRMWRSLQQKYARVDVPVALLTGLGMLPPEGVPDGVRDTLSDIAWGRRALGRKWGDLERGHALAALVRLGGSSALTTPFKLLQARRLPVPVRRAALIAVGRVAGDLTPEERTEAAGVVRTALRRVRDPLTRGLADIAIGRLVSAQVRSGTPLAPDLRSLWRSLLSDARGGSATVRGFAALGVGLAARAGDATEGTGSGVWLKTVQDEAETVLLEGLERKGTDAELKGAFAIGLGVMRSESAVAPLVACVADRGEDDRLRSDAASALGQIGRRSPEVVRALHLALAGTRRPLVRTGAALALSLLHGPAAGHRLLRDLDHARTTADVVRLTEPLGYLADAALASPIIAFARSPDNGAYARALMVVALGNIGDPEPRPTLAFFGEDANYPDAPPTLRCALFTR